MLFSDRNRDKLPLDLFHFGSSQETGHQFPLDLYLFSSSQHTNPHFAVNMDGPFNPYTDPLPCTPCKDCDSTDDESWLENPPTFNKKPKIQETSTDNHSFVYLLGASLLCKGIVLDTKSGLYPENGIVPLEHIPTTAYISIKRSRFGKEMKSFP